MAKINPTRVRLDFVQHMLEKLMGDGRLRSLRSYSEVQEIANQECEPPYNQCTMQEAMRVFVEARRVGQAS